MRERVAAITRVRRLDGRSSLVRPRLVPRPAKIELALVPDNVAPARGGERASGAAELGRCSAALRRSPSISPTGRSRCSTACTSAGRRWSRRPIRRRRASRAAADARRAVPIRIPRPRELFRQAQLRRRRAAVRAGRRIRAACTFSGATFAGTFAGDTSRRQRTHRGGGARVAYRQVHGRERGVAQRRTTSCAPSTSCRAARDCRSRASRSSTRRGAAPVRSRGLESRD